MHAGRVRHALARAGPFDPHAASSRPGCSRSRATSSLSAVRRRRPRSEPDQADETAPTAGPRSSSRRGLPHAPRRTRWRTARSPSSRSSSSLLRGLSQAETAQQLTSAARHGQGPVAARTRAAAHGRRRRGGDAGAMSIERRSSDTELGFARSRGTAARRSARRPVRGGSSPRCRARGSRPQRRGGRPVRVAKAAAGRDPAGIALAALVAALVIPPRSRAGPRPAGGRRSSPRGSGAAGRADVFDPAASSDGRLVVTWRASPSRRQATTTRSGCCAPASTQMTPVASIVSRAASRLACRCPRPGPYAAVDIACSGTTRRPAHSGTSVAGATF